MTEVLKKSLELTKKGFSVPITEELLRDYADYLILRHEELIAFYKDHPVYIKGSTLEFRVMGWHQEREIYLTGDYAEIAALASALNKTVVVEPRPDQEYDKASFEYRGYVFFALIEKART